LGFVNRVVDIRSLTGPHSPFDIIDDLARELLYCFTENPSAPVDERVLKTVMFTDVVSSTESPSAMGDSAWRHQLDSHDSVVDDLLLR
jgi:class 3 adenylate cyclase